MKFYEFKRNDYYALVAATDQQDAIAVYQRDVDETEAEPIPEEVSQQQAAVILSKAVGEDGSQGVSFEEAKEQTTEQSMSQAIVFDAALL